MSVGNIEPTDADWEEAICEGIRESPNGFPAIVTARSIMKWLRNRGLIRRPDPKKILKASLLSWTGRTTKHKMSEVEAANMGAQLVIDLYYAGYKIEPITNP